MSKIFLIGDVHIGLGYPNNSDKWFRIHKDYFDNFLLPLLKKEVKDGDIIISLGDFFDNRNIIPIDLMNYGTDIVERISKIAPLHMVIGNHDLWSKSASEINSIRPFRYIPNVYIYDKPTKIDYNGLKLLMMPYIDDKDDQIEIINKNADCEYLFCHSDLNGAKMHLTSIANRNNNKIDIENFSKFRKVYSGHLHIKGVHKNLTFVGSIFQMDRNDIGDQKGIFIVDTDNIEEKFIENKKSPVFKNISVSTEDDIEKLEQYKNSNDYIDLSISNNLLISNRKLRKKLEIILENSNFSSIDYIDDITNDLISEKNDIIEEGDVINKFEYDEYIKQYILNQNYSNDKFKSNILLEFNDILKIFKDNYK